MPRGYARFMAVFLVGVLLLLSGMLYPATVAHALHHAHHHAPTHATALCAWLCVAGQAADAPPTLLQSESLLLAEVVSVDRRDAQRLWSPPSRPRAPPWR